MRQTGISFLTVALLSTAITRVSAHDIAIANSDGVTIYYKWADNNKSLEVTFPGTSYQNSQGYSGDVNIPEVVIYEGKTYSVTAIGGQAFNANKNLRSVTIPNSVSSIGYGAFELSGIKSINIPTSVTSIGIEAFSRCGSITSISIPHSVKSIGKSAFSGCSNLTTATIGNGIVNIIEDLFGGCSSLKSVTFSGKIRSISKSAFRGCSNLTSMELSDELTSIGAEAFYGCKCLSSLIIPNSVVYIGKDAFRETAWYDNQPDGVVYAGNLVYNYKGTMPSGTKLVIRDGTTRICEQAFVGCKGLLSVTIPASVTSIGHRAFSGCSDMGMVFISNIGAWCNIVFETDDLYGTYVGSNPLTYARHLSLNGEEITDLIIPEGVNSIGGYAFHNCIGLKTATISKTVATIGSHAFDGCTNLASIDIPSSVTDIGQDAFAGTSWYNNFEGLMYLGSTAYKYIGEMPEGTEIVIREGTLEINQKAFEGCSGLTSITIPASLTSIGWKAFEGCNNLSAVHISDISAWCNMSIGYYSNPLRLAHHLYMNGKEIKNLIIPSGVKSINADVFAGCSGLTAVEIPASVTSIGENAFYGCTGLASISIPNSVTSIGNNTFWECNSLTSITLPESIKTINSELFRGCSSLSSITIPNSVTSIGSNAFLDCSSLQSIVIPDNVKTIAGAAFDGCSSLKAISIPSGLTTIENHTFQNCSSLTSIVIPNQVSNIRNSAFRGCSSLTSVILPEGLPSIENELFMNCSSLSSITIPNSVTTIGYIAFSGCSSLESIIIPSGVTNINNAFGGCKKLKYIAFTSDKLTNYALVGNTTAQFVIPQSVYDKGIPSSITNFATYSNTPVYVETKVKGATSAELELHPVGSTKTYPCKILGMTPDHGAEYLTWKLDEENYGIVSVKLDETLALTVQDPKALSTTKARLLASANEADDMVHFGFEWRRIDAPDIIASSKVSAPLYNGKIIGTLNNLNPDVYYKYRPYYQSDAGDIFYGEWIGLFTGDANVFFEPEVYTKDATDITKVSALLAGIFIEGTDDFQEKGFEYWTVSGSKTRAAGSDAKTVKVSGNSMTMAIDGLKAGTEYGYRSYVKTASGTTYGEEKTFKTPVDGDVNGDGYLNQQDVTDMVSHIIGKTPANFNVQKADLNGDGKVNAADVVLLNSILRK